MKNKLGLALVAILFLFSCSKDDTPNTDPAIADKLSGNFKVTEHAETLTFSSTYRTIDTIFYSRTEKVNDSTINFIDTTNNPRRVYRGTIPRTLKTDTRKIWGFGYINGYYSENNDTLHLDVIYGVDASTAYRITQNWVRQ